jgi:hypothetical protein
MELKLIARTLAKARCELRQYFPSKEFEIIPAAIVPPDSAGGHMFCTGLVVAYVAIEKMDAYRA